MEDHGGQERIGNNNNSHEGEPIRSRWTPKPEQILILESIFNSGMVNPPKDETVRIRKLLEKFGSVGDANVFYWFQNRRSRSRRRQRQIQAAANNTNNNNTLVASSSSLANYHHQQVGGDYHGGGGGGAILQYDQTCTYGNNNDPKNNSFLLGMSSSSSSFGGGGSSSFSSSLGSGGGGFFRVNGNGNGGDGYFGCFPYNHQMGFQQENGSSALTSLLCSSSDVVSTLQQQQYQQAGVITVFIDGVPTEVSRGPLDIKALFGQDLILVHSSGIPIPTSDYGFSLQSLQHGESYFLVPRFC